MQQMLDRVTQALFVDVDTAFVMKPRWLMLDALGKNPRQCAGRAYTFRRCRPCMNEKRVIVVILGRHGHFQEHDPG